MPWITPTEAPGGLVEYKIWLPSGVEYEACAVGAFLQLTEAANWEQVTGQSPDVTAAAFFEGWDKSIWWERAMPVGTVIWGGWQTPPDGYLICDGDVYEEAEYPELFAAIGYNFGGAGGFFGVPSLERRVAIGATPSYPLGSLGGKTTHTLTTDEMPAHTHEEHGHLAALAAPGAVPVSAPSVIPAATGSTGGGQAHNNMQPYQALTAVIKAK